MLGDGTDTFGLWIGKSLEVQFQQADGKGRTVLDVKGPEPVAPGRWIHVAAVVKSGEGSIWIDGKQVAQSKRNDPMGEVARTLTFGYAGIDDHFAGSLDDVRVYTHALPAAEIEALAKGAP